MYLFLLLKAHFKNAFDEIFAIGHNRVNWYCGRISKQMNFTTVNYILCGLDIFSLALDIRILNFKFLEATPS